MVFRRSAQSSSLARFVLMALACALIMIADTRGRFLDPVRLVLGAVVTPIHLAASVPGRLDRLIDIWLQSDESVTALYEQVVDENARLRFRLQRMQALEMENRDLRRILSAPQRGDSRMLVGKILEVSLDPYKQTILVNRGAVDAIYVGQPVFDPDGLLGEVSEVMPLTSAVILITDPSHALPVQIVRNGLRAIALGTGRSDRLRIVYLTPNDDIRKGDRLVTSGLGGRFPAGYPVAQVTKLIEDPGEPFMTVFAEPIARIAHNKRVLLVWHYPGTSRRSARAR